MDKMKMHTPDLVDEHIAKIVEIFPNAVTETIKDGKTVRAIDFDILRQELSDALVEGNQERYQFTWPDKRKSILLANAPIAMTLRPCREKSVDFDNTENIYIEGDNLDTLKLLQETYLGKVKLIYIDPPYNTGSDAFVYDDDSSIGSEEFSERSGQYDENGNLLFDIRNNNESNGRFHTDWLNMMYPRLKLAKDLLSAEGLILINMDENELTNLQRICNEIFGEDNNLGTIIWDKRNPKGDARGISYQHENILLYARDKVSFLSKCKVQRPKKNAEAILKKASQLFSKKSLDYTIDDINKDFSNWIRNQKDFSGGEKAYNKIDEEGNVYRPVSMAWPNKKKAPDDYFIPLIHPITNKPCPLPDRGWRNPSSTMNDMLKHNLILFGKDESTIPNSKYLLKDNMYENIPSLLYYGGSDTAMLEEFGVPFDTPKVVDVCKEHILALTTGNDIIMDFFSGSATTAHAVIQANADDGQHRQFIMVQLPEPCKPDTALGQRGFNTICDAGRKRIDKAAEKICNDNTNANADFGYRTFVVDTSNMKDVYYNPTQYQQNQLELFADNIKEDRTPEDLLFQVMLDLGILLSSKIEVITINGQNVFSIADGYLIACFEGNITGDTIKEIAKQKPYYAVFRDNGMVSDSVATNFEQIFKNYSPTTVRKVL